MPLSNRRSRRVVEDEDEAEQAERRPRQRQRRAEPESEEREDENENEQVGGEDFTEEPQDAGEAAAEASPDEQLIKKLVRYAMACDFSRTPIRRDGIKEKVLGDQGRAFRRVFEGAQKVLRQVFGMEMVELPTKDKLTKEEKKKALKAQSKTNSSNSYVLVSMLPDAYKTSAIIAPSRLVSAEEEASYVAFYTMLIALIRLNGGELSSAMLARYLKRLNAEVNSFPGTKTEDTLAKLTRQNYLVKSVDKDARQHGEEAAATTWTVGPRGKVEVGDEAVASFIREIWGSEGRNEELESRLRATLSIRDRDVPVQNRANDAGGDENESRVVQGDGERENGAPEDGGPSRRSGRRRRVQEEEEEEEDE